MPTPMTYIFSFLPLLILPYILTAAVLYFVATAVVKKGIDYYFACLDKRRQPKPENNEK